MSIAPRGLTGPLSISDNNDYRYADVPAVVARTAAYSGPRDRGDGASDGGWTAEANRAAGVYDLAIRRLAGSGAGGERGRRVAGYRVGGRALPLPARSRLRR